MDDEGINNTRLVTTTPGVAIREIGNEIPGVEEPDIKTPVLEDVVVDMDL